MFSIRAILCLAIFATTICHADTDEVIIRQNPKQAQFSLADHGRFLDLANAAVLSPADARSLILAASEAAGVVIENQHNALYGTKADFAKQEAKDFFCLIHVLRWKDPKIDQDDVSKIEPDKQNWYVYHDGKAWRQEDFKDRKRLFGSKNVWLLYIHLNISTKYEYQVRYDIDLKDITPAPLAHLLELAKLFPQSSGESAERYAIWGAHNIPVNHLPNEMAVTPQAVDANKPAGDPPKQVSDAVTFVNEGRYHYDFSVGVPIRRISQVSFGSSDNTVTASKIDKQNIFALVDIYPWKTDVRTRGFNWFPYAIGGTAIAKQPLHKILTAAGWGPAYAQFYFGALFVKQDQLSGLKAGSMATPAQLAAAGKKGFEPQFAFGLNLTVRGVNDLLKKTKDK